MQCKLKSIWLNAPPETTKILHHDIFWFFLCDEEYVSKTINDSNVDLEKFPASKVRQLAKKMESSKATEHHIKQVAGDPQAAQINLMRHQCPEIPPRKNKKKKSYVKSKQPSHKHAVQENFQASGYNKKSFDPRNVHKNKDRWSKCRDSTHVEGFQCPAKKFQCKMCHKFGHFTSLCYQKKHSSSQEDQRHIYSKWEQCMCKKKPYVATLKITVAVMIPSACKFRCCMYKIIQRNFQHQLIL